MANRRYSINNQSKPSGTGSGNASTSPSPTPSSPAPAGNSSGMKIPSGVSPGLLLGLSASYFLVRMFLLGGAIVPIEAIAILIADGFAYTKGDKGQKNIAALIMLFAGLHLIPGFSPWMKAQLNPPGEMAPIVINRDGEYDLPDRPLKVCFKQTGHPEKHWINQEVTIADTWRVIEPYAKCHDLPSSLSGKKVKISLGVFAKQYTPDIKKKFNIGADVNNDYEYYQKMPGGQSGYPVIQAR